jgi:hypothetical protein
MKSLLILPILALVCCKPSENVGNVESNYVMDENGTTLTIREIYLDGKCFYASRSGKNGWVLGPEKK